MGTSFAERSASAFMDRSFLIAAAIVSALVSYAEHALAGTVPSRPDPQQWIGITAIVLRFVVAMQAADDEKKRLLWVVPGALIGLAATALAVAATIWFASRRMTMSTSALAVIRTIVIGALVLAYGLGARSKRVELGWRLMRGSLLAR